MNTTSITYETVTEALIDLAKRGYNENFNEPESRHYFSCDGDKNRINTDDFYIDEVHRFEGLSDPADESIIFAISSKKHDVKGVVINAYGMYEDSYSSKLSDHLHERFKSK